MPSSLVNPSDDLGRLQVVARGFQTRLSQGEGSANLQMLNAYEDVVRSMKEQADGLAFQIAQRQANGEPVPVSWLHKQRRYNALIDQAVTQHGQFARVVGAQREHWMNQALALAQGDAEAMLDASLPGAKQILGAFNRLPVNALKQLRANLGVDALEGSSPVAELLSSYGSKAAAIVDSSLMTGLAEGLHPNQVMARMFAQLKGTFVPNAATVVRTEMYRAYREANRQVYQANDHIVPTWIWNAYLGPFTCASCWAMHGQEFPVDTPMGTHPNCRCTLIPKTKTWAELGFPDMEAFDTPNIQTGSDVFDRLPEADKRKILGPGKYNLYKNGDIKLVDVPHRRQHPDYGTTRSVGSLAQVQANAKQRLAAPAPKAPVNQPAIVSGDLTKAQVRARSIGAPVLPTTDKAAVKTVVDSLIETDTNVANDLALQKRITKNFTQQFKGRVSGVDPDIATALQDSLNDAHEETLYRQLTDKYGRNNAILTKGELEGREKYMAAQRLPSYTRFYDNKYNSPEKLYNREIIKPGASDVFELRGGPGLVRHEYGHYLQDEHLTAEQTKTILSNLPEDKKDVAEGLTLYATSHPQEALSEIFATVTDPTYDPTNYPDWVNTAGQQMLSYLLP